LIEAKRGAVQRPIINFEKMWKFSNVQNKKLAK
jgi:hypothetical protein